MVPNALLHDVSFCQKLNPQRNILYLSSMS
jgi:hypothetical protein